MGFPALQSTHLDVRGLAGQAQSRASGVSHANVLGHDAAIFEADHSS
jgi:hypothetical protein